ncbi:transmembrane protein 138-like [Tenrec ecaudatus]|uniref:transmembrane protein 138-like n=1 Tax=Tenrec ecaudatus TaxID=94439 RepID=UPI003F5A3BD0
MLQTSNYSLVLLQFLLLTSDLFGNSFSELRTAAVLQQVLVTLQGAALPFSSIILCLMFFNTIVFQAGLGSLLFHKFKGAILLTVEYFAPSMSLRIWVMNLLLENSDLFVWPDGLQTLCLRD